MGRALALLLVAVLTGLLVYWLAAPRLLSPAGEGAQGEKEAGNSHSLVTDASGAEDNAARSTVIEAPRTPEQKEHDALEAKRAPFYARARRECSPLLQDARVAQGDPVTLDLYAGSEDSQAVNLLMAQAVQPDAKRYGFRHVRFFLLNPPSEIERYRLDAEANIDEAGVWHTYRK